MTDEPQPQTGAPNELAAQGLEPGLSPATLAVWAGEGDAAVQGATQVPVVYSAAYAYPDVDAWLDVALGRARPHLQPQHQPHGARLRGEGAPAGGRQAATSFATGMAAVSNTLFALLRAGDRVVSVKDTYGGTTRCSPTSCRAWTSRWSCATRATTS